MEKKNETEKTRPPLSPRVQWTLLAVTLCSIAVIVFLIVKGRQPDREVVVEEVPPAATEEPYLGQTHDAEADPETPIRAGHRYEVKIFDQAREGTDGIARIGGKITFIPDARIGETLIVEVTRVKNTVAEARIVERLSEPAAAQVPAAAPVDATTQGPVLRGIVEDVGSKGDGLVRHEGKVVFLPGTRVGDDVSYKITSDREKFAIGQVVDRHGQADIPSATPAPEPGDENEVTIGREYEVEITEKDRKLPDVNGVARIDGLVIFVPATQPGDRVRIKIVDRAPRFARAEVLERLP